MVDTNRKGLILKRTAVEMLNKRQITRLGNSDASKDRLNGWSHCSSLCGMNGRARRGLRNTILRPRRNGHDISGKTNYMWHFGKVGDAS
jgi:hypothetical protein